MPDGWIIVEGVCLPVSRHSLINSATPAENIIIEKRFGFNDERCKPL
jgi:hypothetical protein